MATMTVMTEQTMGYDVQKIQQIREKVKQVFDWNCSMNDTMLLRRYTIDSDGDLVMIVR
jgi:predicted polyphosphate/ATP-dependent NAD kinase